MRVSDRIRRVSALKFHRAFVFAIATIVDSCCDFAISFEPCFAMGPVWLGNSVPIFSLISSNTRYASALVADKRESLAELSLNALLIFLDSDGSSEECASA